MSDRPIQFTFGDIGLTGFPDTSEAERQSRPLPVHCTCGCDAFETNLDEHGSFRCIACKTIWRGLSMRDATVKTWSFSGTVKT